MGKRGFPPQPVERKILNGTYRADRDGPLPDPNEPITPPSKPEGLEGDASALWDRLIPLLAGVVRERDGDQLVEMCRWWATARKLHKALDRAAPGSLRCTRLMGQTVAASQSFDRIAKRFGLTPADRSALRAELAVAPKPKVPTRPRTALDKRGKPRGA